MEEEIKKQQILQKSLSLSNLDTFSIEKKKKEIESGIKKEKIMKSLESIPSLNLVNKFSKTTASILIYKILCIQFPHYQITSDNGKNYLIRKLSFQESFIRGTSIPNLPDNLKQKLMNEIKVELFSRNSARNLLALSQSQENISSSNLEIFIEKNFKNDNQQESQNEDDTEEVIPSAHSLLQMKRFSPISTNRIQRSQTVPILNVVPSTKEFYNEMQKSIISFQSFQNNFYELREDLEKKYRLLQGDVMKINGDIQYCLNIIHELKVSCFKDFDPLVDKEDVVKELDIINRKEEDLKYKRKKIFTTKPYVPSKKIKN